METDHIRCQLLSPGVSIHDPAWLDSDYGQLGSNPPTIQFADRHLSGYRVNQMG